MTGNEICIIWYAPACKKWFSSILLKPIKVGVTPKANINGSNSVYNDMTRRRWPRLTPRTRWPPWSGHPILARTARCCGRTGACRAALCSGESEENSSPPAVRHRPCKLLVSKIQLYCLRGETLFAAI